VAVTWVLLATEACLDVCLGGQGKYGFNRMIKHAIECGLITPEESAALNDARKLRNVIVHGALLPSFAPSSAVTMVKAVHDAVSDIYRRAAARQC